MFQGIGERMTKELTALAPSTMRSRWLHHQRESTRYGLEGLSCLPSAHSSRCGSRRASTMNLARPSSTGSASEGRISEQQCCMEIDSFSKVHRVPTWRDLFTTSLL